MASLAATAIVLTATLIPLGAAAAERSLRAEVLFRLENPCPSTGEAYGTCEGYVIDRIVPHVCGGAEDPGNMQWLTPAAAKAKARWDRIGCRPGREFVIPDDRAVPAEVFPLGEPAAPVEARPLPVE